MLSRKQKKKPPRSSLSEVVKRKVKKRIEMKMLPFGDFHLFYLKTKEKYLALTLLFLGKEREKFACFFLNIDNLADGGRADK